MRPFMRRYGGCPRGKVRYGRYGLAEVVDCPCRMCRKHSGVPFMTLLCTARQVPAFLEDMPRSSEREVRGDVGHPHQHPATGDKLNGTIFEAERLDRR